MKKILLTCITLSFAFGVAAQRSAIPKMVAEKDVAHPAKKKYFIGNEPLQNINYNVPKEHESFTSFKDGAEEIEIGDTWYDLQSNASVQRRIINHGDGTISAVWTYSDNSGFADRGTGYNFFDGTEWGPFPDARIEGDRVGWPSLIAPSSGGEVVLAHNTNLNLITQNTRATIGSGDWSEDDQDTLDIEVWNRAAGAGDFIHMIGLTLPEANDGTIYNGLDGALLYNRSSDGGATWDIKNVQIEGLDSTVVRGFSGDSYSIDARDSIVAFVVFGEWADVVLAKSVDNGETWDTTIINDFPITRFQADDGSDIDGDGMFDTLNTSDGSGTVLIDGDGMVHVWYGAMRVLDADTTDGNTSYFPGTNGLVYWNESMATGQLDTITGAVDIDGSGVIEAPADIALYFASLSSMPSAGMDAAGNIYLVYSAFIETAFTSQHFRHLYAMKSSDGGATWSEPNDITPGLEEDGLIEAVFGSLAKLVDENLHIVYQFDFEPGLNVRGDMDPASINDIKYLKVDTVLNVGLEEYTSSVSNLKVFPNPTADVVNVTFTLQQSERVQVDVYDMIGNRVLRVSEENMPSGFQQLEVNLEGQPTGIYLVMVNSGNGQVTGKKVTLMR